MTRIVSVGESKKTVGLSEKVTLHVDPHRDASSKALVTAESLRVAPHVRHLYAHLAENESIQPIRGFKCPGLVTHR